MADLFPDDGFPRTGAPTGERREVLHQWFTPAWAAQAIVEQQFGWLGPGHRVLEPSCGDGSFLGAIPAGVKAIGVEIDPALAHRANASTGRRGIVGDILRPQREDVGPIHAIIGNPPFEAQLVAALLSKAASLLVEGGEADLPRIYDAIESRRPLQQSILVRKDPPVLRDTDHFHRTGQARYALKA